MEDQISTLHRSEPVAEVSLPGDPIYEKAVTAVAPAAEAKVKAPKPDPRPYLVLEEMTYEDGSVAYSQVGGPVKAHNAPVALRLAFKELCSQDPDRTTARLVAVASRSFKVTGLVIHNRQTVSVAE